MSEKKVLGILGIIFGGIALLLSWVPIINNIAFFFGIVGAILGIIALIVNRKNKKTLAIIGTVLSIVSIIIVLVTQSAYGKAVDNISTSINTSDSSDKKDNNYSYKNNIFKTDKGVIKLTGQDKTKSSDDKDAIVIKFSYNNTTKESQDLSMLLMDFFEAEQNLGSTTSTLNPLMLDSDSPFYNEYKIIDDKINPGATVNVAYPFILKDSSKSMKLKLRNQNDKVIGSKMYELK